MTREEVEARMEELITQKKEFCEPIDKELRKLSKLMVELTPKTMDFSEHEKKNISHIKAVNSNGDDVWLPTDEIVKVKNGKPYFSSYNRGIIRFDKEIGKYVHHYHGSAKVLDIVGFYDVVFEDDEE